MATTSSDKGIDFTAINEGFVSKAYKDAGGVRTIGNGFTMLSKTFAAYWRETRGHALRDGDTISRSESKKVLRAIMAAEYAPPVAARFGGLPQNEFDAAADMTYNCGAGTLKDRWAKRLDADDVEGAAALLPTTRVTSRGKKLAGLVYRRRREANLLQYSDYGNSTFGAINADFIKSYQADLKALGFYAGAVDGVIGPETRQAVMHFQAAKGLVEDGIVGPATLAAIARAIAAKKATTVAKATAPAGAAGGAAVHTSAVANVEPSVILWALGAGAITLAVLGLGYLIWTHRGVILRRRTPA